jgi:V-type H+-transporting ATPase 16kDa proteolipid subunit
MLITFDTLLPFIHQVMRNIIPVVMAGVLGIYGLIVAVIIQGSILTPDSSGATKYSSFTGK